MSASREDEMRSFDRDDHLADPDIWAPDDLWWLLEGWAVSMPCRCTLAQ